MYSSICLTCLIIRSYLCGRTFRRDSFYLLFGKPYFFCKFIIFNCKVMADGITRTFHPVGQGAFYSEKINGFNFVYDCGALPYKKTQKKVISQSFDKTDEIDLLAISHFDEDHINLIPALKATVKKIKTVVFPLMTPAQQAYILSFYKKTDLYEIVLDPRTYFEKANIVKVWPASPEDKTIKDGNLYLNDLQGVQEIDSGEIIRLSSSFDWIYIPYNCDNKAKYEKIKTLLDDIFQSSGKSYTQEDIVAMLSNKNTREKIRNIYAEVGGTNENSMLMYSGPTAGNIYSMKHFFRRFCGYCPWLHTNSSGCLYTGDATIDKNILPWIDAIKNTYPVGTIQIPHHGSMKSFNSSLLDHGFFHCVISVGKNNIYGHPSGKVLKDILSYDMCPILVTDDPTSCFIESGIKLK